MAKLPPRIIDCTKRTHLLAACPVAAEIRRSETACALLADLCDDWTLAGKDLDDKDYVIDEPSRTITLNTRGLSPGAILCSHHFQNKVVLSTLAALRAAWQAERKGDAHRMHRPDIWPLIDRVLNADIAAMATRMAYEIRNTGGSGVWRHALGDAWGDIAVGYAKTMDHADASAACAGAFMQWFSKGSRIDACDYATLSEMDAALASLTMNGRGQIGEGAIRCLTIDPLSGVSYLGSLAGHIAGDPAWRNINDPVAEAHFSQIIEDIGATHIGYLSIRDKKLAARLFPDALINA